MQIKVDEENVEALEKLAKFHRRSPTQEANLAISDHLNGIWVQADKACLSPTGKKHQRVREKRKKL